MPFKSEKQKEYLRINHPDIYRRWMREYGSEPKEDDVTMEARNQRIRKKSNAKKK